MKDLVKFGIVAVVGYFAYDWYRKKQQTEAAISEGVQDAIEDTSIEEAEDEEDGSGGGTTLIKSPLKLPTLAIDAAAIEGKYADTPFGKMPPAVQMGTYLSTQQKIDYILGSDFSHFGNPMSTHTDWMQAVLQKAREKAKAAAEAKAAAKSAASEMPVLPKPITTEDVVAELEESGEEGAAAAAEAIRGKHTIATLNCVLRNLKSKFPRVDWGSYKKKRVDAAFVMERCLRSSKSGNTKAVWRRRKCKTHPSVTKIRGRAFAFEQKWMHKKKISMAASQCRKGKGLGAAIRPADRWGW